MVAVEYARDDHHTLSAPAFLKVPAVLGKLTHPLRTSQPGNCSHCRNTFTTGTATNIGIKNRNSFFLRFARSQSYSDLLISLCESPKESFSIFCVRTSGRRGQTQANLSCPWATPTKLFYYIIYSQRSAPTAGTLKAAEGETVPALVRAIRRVHCGGIEFEVVTARDS